MEKGYSCIIDHLTWYPRIVCCPCFLIGLAFTPLMVVIVSSIDSPPFRQSLITLNISSAVSSPCAQFSHMVLWSGTNGSIVRATMMSLGVCGSGLIGHITCVYGLYLRMVKHPYSQSYHAAPLSTSLKMCSPLPQSLYTGPLMLS